MASANESNVDVLLVGDKESRSGVTAASATAPTRDATRLLTEIAAQLESVPKKATMRAAGLIDSVENLDWRGRDILAELKSRFLAGEAGIESEEQVRAWKSARRFLSRLTSTYLFLVRVFQTYGRGWAEVGDRLPLVIARAMRANADRMTWMHMRYRTIDEVAWKNLSQLWSFVEDKGMARARVLVYEDRSTLQREFTKPLMLAMSAPDSLSPQEVDVADRLIAHVAGRFDVQRYPARGCHFLIDIDQWTLPERHRPGDVVRLGSRFFGPGEALIDLETISAKLAENEISTKDINLAGVADVELVIDVLAHLERHWSSRRPERKGQRRRAVSKIAVVLGYSDVVGRVKNNDTDASPEDEDVEFWSVENESEAGYGALVTLERSARLRIGELVAVRQSGSRSWAVGVIRRLVTQDSAQRYVGIALLGRGVQAVSISDARSGEGVETALLLPSHIGESVGQGEINLLMRGGGFSPDVQLDMNVYDNSYLLEPLMVLDEGENYEVGRYRIEERAM